MKPKHINSELSYTGIPARNTQLRTGKCVLIIDDMISSGESMLDTAKALKDRKAARVVVCCTFGLFTSGLEKFDEFYAKGYLDYL